MLSLQPSMQKMKINANCKKFCTTEITSSDFTNAMQHAYPPYNKQNTMQIAEPKMYKGPMTANNTIGKQPSDIIE